MLVDDCREIDKRNSRGRECSEQTMKRERSQTIPENDLIISTLSAIVGLDVLSLESTDISVDKTSAAFLEEIQGRDHIEAMFRSFSSLG